MKIDLSSLKNAELVSVHNKLNPDAPVKGFKNSESGIEKINEIVAEQNKGKNKALFATRVSTLPIAVLALLAPHVVMAKDLTTRIFPVHIQVLSKLKEMGANESHIEKDAFHSAFGIDASDAKLADALNVLYKQNFLIWEQDDTMMISEAANNFLEANPELVDSETMFADLISEKPKAQREKKEGTGTSRSRYPDSHVITPLVETNPCQPAKRRYQMHSKWIGKTGSDRLTVGEYKADGGILFDLGVAVILGHAAVQDPSEKPAVAVPKEPKASKKKAKEVEEVEVPAQD